VFVKGLALIVAVQDTYSQDGSPGWCGGSGSVEIDEQPGYTFNIWIYYTASNIRNNNHLNLLLHVRRTQRNSQLAATTQISSVERLPNYGRR
jgi:hypothetical protein